MPDPTITQLTPDERDIGNFDPTQYPYQRQAANLYWNGSSWVKWDKSITVGSAGSSGGQVDAHPVESTGTDLVLTTGGQTGVKDMIVGDGDKYVRGILAHGVADTGIEPVVTGSKAASSAPTAVSAGQVVRQYMDTQGRLFVTADKTGTFLTVETAPTGALSDGTVTLTLANTAYAVPDSAVPTAAYLLIVSANVANTTEMRWRVTSGTTGGNPIAPGASMTIRLPASQPLYLYSTAAGQIANYSRMTI